MNDGIINWVTWNGLLILTWMNHVIIPWETWQLNPRMVFLYQWPPVHGFAIEPPRRNFCFTVIMMPKRNGRHFTHDILKCIFFNKIYRILLQIPLMFAHRGPRNPPFNGGLPHKWRVLRNVAWWRHQMGTFSVLLAHCAENEFPLKGQGRRFDVFFDLRLNKWFSE